MKKINREFDERCIKLRNRIQRLKNEEENYQKKMLNYRKKEIQDRQIKDDKNKLKRELQKRKDERNKALIDKRKMVRSQREKDNIIRVNKKNANLSQKKLNYQTSLNDKYLMKIVKEQLNSQQLNKNSSSHAKIKQELNEYEANKMKRNLEKKNRIQKMHENNIVQLKLLEKEMKTTCDQLEELEKQAMENLNKTKHMNFKLAGDDPYNHNKSINPKRSKNFKKQVNRSMENINVNGKIDDNEDDNYQNRSVYVKKNGMARNNKSKGKFTNRNKSKKKYGSPISISSYPNKIKSNSVEKIDKQDDKNNNNNVEKNKEEQNLNK